MPHPPSTISTTTSTTTPVHDQGQAFEEACRRRDYGALQVAVSGMDKRDACTHLAALFPAQSHRWFVRNFALLMSMDPDEFWRLAYKDETGETAVASVMAAAA